MILRVFGPTLRVVPVCLGAVHEDVRVRALAAGRADEDAVSLVPGSFESGGRAAIPQRHRAVRAADAGQLLLPLAVTMSVM
jgi:hypothetical protein